MFCCAKSEVDHKLVCDEHIAIVKKAGRLVAALAICIMIVRVCAYYLSNSLAIEAALLDTLKDFCVSMGNLFAVRMSTKLADRKYQFGYGKFEALASLGQALLLLVLGSSLLYEGATTVMQVLAGSGIGGTGGVAGVATGMTAAAGATEMMAATGTTGMTVVAGAAGAAAAAIMDGAAHDLPHISDQGNTTLTVMFLLLSLFLLVIMVCVQTFFAKKIGSTALKADSAHYKADVFMNVFVLFCFLASKEKHLEWLEGGFGIAVAIYFFVIAWVVAKVALRCILDISLPEDVQERARGVVAGVMREFEGRRGGDCAEGGGCVRNSGCACDSGGAEDGGCALDVGYARNGGCAEGGGCVRNGGARNSGCVLD